jgi:hypothetical protein
MVQHQNDILGEPLRISSIVSVAYDGYHLFGVIVGEDTEKYYVKFIDERNATWWHSPCDISKQRSILCVTRLFYETHAPWKNALRELSLQLVHIKASEKDETNAGTINLETTV